MGINVILIGIGGIGRETLQELLSLERELSFPISLENLDIIYIDTSKPDIDIFEGYCDNFEKETGIKPNIMTFRLANISVDKALNMMKRNKPENKQIIDAIWSNNLPKGTGVGYSEAGANPPLGHLMLHYTIFNTKNEIFTKLKELINRKLGLNKEMRMDIFLISSLFGGTSGGVAIPFSAILRKHIEGISNVNFISMFFLPEPICKGARKVPPNQPLMHRHKAVTMAELKLLNLFQNERWESWIIPSPKNFEDIHLNPPRNVIYDLVFLCHEKDQNNVQLSPDDYKPYLKMAANTIISLTGKCEIESASQIIPNLKGGQNCLASYLSYNSKLIRPTLMDIYELTFLNEILLKGSEFQVALEILQDSASSQPNSKIIEDVSKFLSSEIIPDDPTAAFHNLSWIDKINYFDKDDVNDYIDSVSPGKTTIYKFKTKLEEIGNIKKNAKEWKTFYERLTITFKEKLDKKLENIINDNNKSILYAFKFLEELKRQVAKTVGSINNRITNIENNMAREKETNKSNLSLFRRNANITKRNISSYKKTLKNLITQKERLENLKIFKNKCENILEKYIEPKLKKWKEILDSLFYYTNLTSFKEEVLSKSTQSDNLTIALYKSPQEIDNKVTESFNEFIDVNFGGDKISFYQSIYSEAISNILKDSFSGNDIVFKKLYYSLLNEVSLWFFKKDYFILKQNNSKKRNDFAILQKKLPKELPTMFPYDDHCSLKRASGIKLESLISISEEPIRINETWENYRKSFNNLNEFTRQRIWLDARWNDRTLPNPEICHPQLIPFIPDALYVILYGLEQPIESKENRWYYKDFCLGNKIEDVFKYINDHKDEGKIRELLNKINSLWANFDDKKRMELVNKAIKKIKSEHPLRAKRLENLMKDNWHQQDYLVQL